MEYDVSLADANDNRQCIVCGELASAGFLARTRFSSSVNGESCETNPEFSSAIEFLIHYKVVRFGEINDECSLCETCRHLISDCECLRKKFTRNVQNLHERQLKFRSQCDPFGQLELKQVFEKEEDFMMSVDLVQPSELDDCLGNYGEAEPAQVRIMRYFTDSD
jgi:hypothetical protein